MKTRLLLAVTMTALIVAPAASANHQQQIQPDVDKLDYAYEQDEDGNYRGAYFKPGDPLPPANAFEELIKPLMDGKRFNPSGDYNAFDTNVFEVLALPYRAAGDEFGDDPYGNGGAAEHGHCGDDPRSDRNRPGSAGYPEIAGECFNHQREYLDYYEETMKDVLGDFGVTFRSYEFLNPTDSTQGDAFGPPLLSSNTMGGRAVNLAAIVPGAEHPEETVVIGAHYDQTNDGPASAWDSQEGHAQIIRVAKLMADYWRETGTRPAATVKFIPWDAEESGTLGSAHYADNVIPPGDEEFKVRGYWNTDPCAGGYPAYRFGNPAERVQLGIQVANPMRADDTAQQATAGLLADPNLDPKYHERIYAFNDRADDLVADVLEALDDTIVVAGREVEVFVAPSEATADKPSDLGDDSSAGIRVGTGRPYLFSSDWRNFENRGIPFFNPGPEITGPNSDAEVGNSDALTILHTPNDNLQTMNAYTGVPGGGTMSEAWMKGMELCAHMLAWGMLQPDQGGAQPVDDRVVPYYEALPNEAAVDEPVLFDARGSQQELNGSPESSHLTYSWDFGDGTTGSGQRVYHRYSRTGVYPSKLTVTGANGKSATMSVPITVVPTPTSTLPHPELAKPAAEDEDGTFDLDFSVPNVPSNVTGFEVLEARAATVLFTDDAEGDLGPRWTASEPTYEDIEPWQKSDSDTTKYRDNQAASGEASYWTGVQPQNFGVGAFVSNNNVGEVQSGQSVLTLNEPIQVPPSGTPVLQYNTIFQSEGDDTGEVQVAVAGTDQWRTVDRLQAVNTSLGDTDPMVCDPTQPSTLQSGFLQRSADLSGFRGQRIVMRLVYTLGPENRSVSQPCGWYVDDLEVSASRFTPIGTTTDVTPSGQDLTGTFTVTGRPAGTYMYRVVALYPPGDHAGPVSSPQAVTVTKGAPPSGGGGGGGTPPPGDGGSGGGADSGGADDGGASGGSATPAQQPAATGPRVTVLGERASSARERALRRCLANARKLKGKTRRATLKRRAAAKRRCHRRYGARR